MSVADQRTPASRLPRRDALNVRLSPQFANRLSARIQRNLPAGKGMNGLLFGVADEGVVILQAFKSFTDSDYTEPWQFLPEQLDETFETAVAAAQTDPEVSSLDLIGWFSLRRIGGLHLPDLVFHNRHFPRLNHLALVLRPEESGDLLLEIYSRASNALLSAEDHRWGALRLSTDIPIAGAVEIAMHGSVDDEVYSRSHNPEQREQRKTFSLLRSKQPKAEREEEPKALDFGPASLEESIALRPATAMTRPAERSLLRDQRPLPESAGMVRISAGPPPTVPAVIPRRKKRRVPWVSSAILFALAAGATFAVLLLRGLPSGNIPLFLRPLLPDTRLGLKVEGQGDRVLLSWNRRNSVVRSAVGGTLHIDDGAQHRDVPLDASQVENGAVLYRPGSGDVMFRLEVRGQQGATVVESTRVLDGRAGTTPPEVGANSTATAAGTKELVAADQHNWKPSAQSRAAVPIFVSPSSRSASDMAERASQPEPTTALNPGTSSVTPSSPSPGKLSPEPATSSSAESGSSRVAPPNSETASSTASKPLQTAASNPTGLRPQEPTSDGNAPTKTTKEENDPAPVKQASSSTQQQLSPAAQANVPSGDPLNKAPATPVRAPGQSATARNYPQDYVPPKPVRKMLPDMRIFSAGGIASLPEVEVTVRVDKSGRVTEAHVVDNGNKVKPALAGAALIAAKQWIFQPALFRGQYVESDHTIVFQFHAAK
jgi:hypothetical protein